MSAEIEKGNERALEEINTIKEVFDIVQKDGVKGLVDEGFSRLEKMTEDGEMKKAVKDGLRAAFPEVVEYIEKNREEIEEKEDYRDSAHWQGLMGELAEKAGVGDDAIEAGEKLYEWLKEDEDMTEAIRGDVGAFGKVEDVAEDIPEPSVGEAEIIEMEEEKSYKKQIEDRLYRGEYTCRFCGGKNEGNLDCQFCGKRGMSEEMAEGLDEAVTGFMRTERKVREIDDEKEEKMLWKEWYDENEKKKYLDNGEIAKVFTRTRGEKSAVDDTVVVKEDEKAEEVKDITTSGEAENTTEEKFWQKMTEVYDKETAIKDATSTESTEVNGLANALTSNRSEIIKNKDALFILHDFARKVDEVDGFDELMNRYQEVGQRLGRILGLRDKKGRFVVMEALVKYDQLARGVAEKGGLFALGDEAIKNEVLRVNSGSELDKLAQMVAKDIYAITGGADRYGFSFQANTKDKDTGLDAYSKLDTKQRDFIRGAINFKKSLIGGKTQVSAPKLVEGLDWEIASYWEVFQGKYFSGDSQKYSVLTKDGLMELIDKLNSGDLSYATWFRELKGASETKTLESIFMANPNRIDALVDVLTKGYGHKIGMRTTTIAETRFRAMIEHFKQVGFPYKKGHVSAGISADITMLVGKGAMDTVVAEKLRRELHATPKDVTNEAMLTPKAAADFVGTAGSILQDFFKLFK